MYARVSLQQYLENLFSGDNSSRGFLSELLKRQPYIKFLYAGMYTDIW